MEKEGKNKEMERRYKRLAWQIWSGKRKNVNKKRKQERGEEGVLVGGRNVYEIERKRRAREIEKNVVGKNDEKAIKEEKDENI